MTRSPSTLPLAILFHCVFTLCLVGCGGNPPPEANPRAATGAAAGAATVVDACALLTAAEISTATGIEAGAGSDPAVGVPACHWPRSDREPPFDAFVQVTVVADTARSFDTWIAQFQGELVAMGAAFDADDYRQVEDLGDWAVYLQDGSLLMVGHDGILLQILVSGSNDPSPGTALARLALAKLGT